MIVSFILTNFLAQLIKHFHYIFFISMEHKQGVKS